MPERAWSATDARHAGSQAGLNAADLSGILAGALDRSGANRPQAEIGMASAPELVCIFGGRGKRGRVRLPGRQNSKQDDAEPPAERGWTARLWRSVCSWLIPALIAFVAAGRLRAAEPGGAGVSLTAHSQSAPLAAVAYSAKARKSTQPGSPNSGAFDAPRVHRPYWESPNIIIEEADEYPHPKSLEVDDPNSFWYTLRPNVLNIAVPDEWDFYNLINTDRPDFTDAVYSVGKGVTYLENGYFFRNTHEGPTRISTRQLPQSLLRHGLTDEFELRVKWNGYVMTDYRDATTGVHLSEFGGDDLNLGFKWELIQQQGWRPMVSVVSGAIVPTGTRGISADAVQPHFNMVYGWGLRRWLYLKGQTGADFLRVSNAPVSDFASAVPGFVVERSNQASWHQSFCILSQWTKHVGAFHEWFMISNTGAGDARAQHFLDMGTYIYLTPNIQLDARIGTRLSNRVSETLAGAGFSARW